ncbi:class I SAM-dependent methyltransferase [Laribacter hongkongensis]|uniref:class I SAM-dependent methyltransferase n=1 Tax=Laribacter hongkongensis TaxID=168471 RepID=UPI0023D934E1
MHEMIFPCGLSRQRSSADNAPLPRLMVAMFHGLLATPDVSPATLEHFAASYGLPCLATPPDEGYWLAWREGVLGLESPHHGAVTADFVGGAARHRREFGGGAGQPVARAIGLKGGQRPQVVDATAGLGRDAFVMASLGCRVTLVERSPVAAALLDDALARARLAPATHEIAARMQLVFADAADWLAQQPAGSVDVVYLDPMFPDTGKSAAAKKEMQAFQVVVGDDLDAGRLLLVARQVAGKRVVVKRPRLGALLTGEKPAGQQVGKSTRFDLYAPLPSASA